MKKILLFLTTLLLITSSSFAQFTNVWKALADGTTYTWLNAATNANNVTSLAYNPATNKLLVSNRNSNVYILNASTGVQEGTLSLVGLGAESFKFNKIRVDADGVIYGISLATAATTSAKIYRWANQSANPVECASFTSTERVGDSFGLSGTGVNTVLYASGSATVANAFSIYILNTANGTNFTTESKVTMTSSPTAGEQWANRTVEPVGTGVNSDIWINASGFNARRISISAPVGGVRTATSEKAISDGLGAGQASIGYGGMRYVAGPVNKFLVFAGGNNAESGTVMRALNVKDEAAITTHGTESLYATSSYVTNGNGTGDVSFRSNIDGSFTIFYLSTNNGIGATTSAPAVLPVIFTEFTGVSTKGQVVLNWETASEANNDGFSVERSLDGKQFDAIGFVKAKSANNNGGNYEYIDKSVSLTASTAYYRLNQLDLDGKSEYSKVIAVKRNESTVARFYPSITTGNLTIETASDAPSVVKISNLNGSTVLTKTVTGTAKLDVSTLTAGVYIVSFNYAGALTIGKFIKK